MAECSVKKEIIPHECLISCKPRKGALISFSEMETYLALFSPERAFGSFVGTKEQEHYVDL
jgi:hypothetical protein